MEEFIDLYDDNKRNTGIVISRTKENNLPEGHHILVSALLVENNEKKIMLQLTSKSKGNILALPSGHVLHGENSKDTIVREMYEEQGVIIDINKITLIEERLANRIAFFDIYYLKANFDINNMVLQKEEVENVLWLSPNEIISAYNNGRIRKSSYESIMNFINLKDDKKR